MLQHELVIKIAGLLERAGIEYMLTGSFVSGLQGMPRSTHGTDFIINISEKDISKLLSVFSPDEYYIDTNQIKRAVRDKNMFNMIEYESGYKIDFWLLTKEPFDKTRFSRRILEKFNGENIHVSTPEDTILMKLKWALESGGSQKQINDALMVFKVQFEILDFEYIKYHYEALNLPMKYRISF